MSSDIRQLIDGYLDETLSADEQLELNVWLKGSPDNARHFADAVLLHDRLRGEFLAKAAMAHEQRPVPANSRQDSRSRRYRPFVAVASVTCAVVAVALILWKGLGETPASAAASELHRIIAVSAQPIDRTYLITVEDFVPPPPRGGKRPPPPGHGPPPHPPMFRPPHPPAPPMNGAVLHVRGGRQFVLVRKLLDGRPFVTGSNGLTSWAVRPDEPVRVSEDLNRFSRGVPGQQLAVPLINVQEGLEGLLQDYDVQLTPLAGSSSSGEANAKDKERQQLVAVKKAASLHGPNRVEITYAVRTGLIQEMRFVDMPRARQKPVTLLLTLLEERNLDSGFFDHESHHEPGRKVLFEE